MGNYIVIAYPLLICCYVVRRQRLIFDLPQGKHCYCCSICYYSYRGVATMVDRHYHITCWLVTSFISLYGNIKSSIFTSLSSSHSFFVHVCSSHVGACVLLLPPPKVNFVNVFIITCYISLFSIIRLLHVPIVTIVLYGFIVFLPFSYGYPALSNEQVLSRQWQPLWHLLYHKTVTQ